MAVRTASLSTLPATRDYDGVTLVTWTGLTNATSDSGSPVELLNQPVRTVQILGTFGVGGTVVIEGSLDGTNYVTLTDPQGNALSKTAAGIEAVCELPRYIRPRVTAGDGTTSLTVLLLCKKD